MDYIMDNDNHHSQKTRKTTTSKTIIAIVLALGILASTAANAFLTTTTPAYAVSTNEKVIERFQATAARAEWTDVSIEVPGVGTVVGAFVQAVRSDTGTDVFVGLQTAEGNFANGFATVDPSVFTIDKKLTSATLSPVTIEVTVFDEFGDPIGTAEITIQATWEGTGDVFTDKINDHIKFGKFSEKFKGTANVRDAIAEGSLNGANLGTSEFADLIAVKTVEMTVSSIIS
jgi:hypothetical protein